MTLSVDRCDSIATLKVAFDTDGGAVIFVELGTVVAIALTHGLLSAAEIAALSVRKGRLRDLVDRGHPSAKAIFALRDVPERLLATVRTGLALTGGASGVVAGVFFERDLEAYLAPSLPSVACARALGVLVTVLVVGLLLVTVGELVPQTLALRSPERHALRAGIPLYLLSKIMRIPARVASSLSNVLLLPTGAKTSFVDARLSEEELHQLVDEAAKVGTVDPLAGTIASRAIDFGRLTVADALVPRNDIVSISVHANTAELQQTLLESGHSRLPVFDRSPDDIIGYISAKDVLALTVERQLFVVQDLVRPAYFVPEAMRAVTLLEELQKRCIHLAFVADSQGGLVGIVTMEDLLEELVGDIFSEHDGKVSSSMQKAADGSLVVDGMVPVRDVNRELDIELPEGDSWSTVAGLCIALAGRIPQPGEQIVSDDGTLLEILEGSHRRVRSVRVRHASSRPPAP